MLFNEHIQAWLLSDNSLGVGMLHIYRAQQRHQQIHNTIVKLLVKSYTYIKKIGSSFFFFFLFIFFPILPTNLQTKITFDLEQVLRDP